MEFVKENQEDIIDNDNIKNDIINKNEDLEKLKKKCKKKDLKDIKNDYSSSLIKTHFFFASLLSSSSSSPPPKQPPSTTNSLSIKVLIK